MTVMTDLLVVIGGAITEEEEEVHQLQGTDLITCLVEVSILLKVITN
jgi:hypothetical protein